jgi:hypothetical protein
LVNWIDVLWFGFDLGFGSFDWEYSADQVVGDWAGIVTGAGMDVDQGEEAKDTGRGGIDTVEVVVDRSDSYDRHCCDRGEERGVVGIVDGVIGIVTEMYSAWD